MLKNSNIKHAGSSSTLLLFPPQFPVCSYAVSMPSVRHCNVKSRENEREDVEFVGCVQTFDCWREIEIKRNSVPWVSHGEAVQSSETFGCAVHYYSVSLSPWSWQMTTLLCELCHLGKSCFMLSSLAGGKKEKKNSKKELDDADSVTCVSCFEVLVLRLAGRKRQQFVYSTTSALIRRSWCGSSR